MIYNNRFMKTSISCQYRSMNTNEKMYRRIALKGDNFFSNFSDDPAVLKFITRSIQSCRRVNHLH